MSQPSRTSAPGAERTKRERPGERMHVMGRVALPMVIPVGRDNALSLEDIASRLNQRLNGNGHFKPKTVKRYIDELNDFDSDCQVLLKPDGKKYLYYLSAPYPALNKHNLSDDMALSVMVALAVAGERLPPEVVRELRVIESIAIKRLSQADQDWVKRFRVIPAGMTRYVPEVNDRIRSTLMQALRDERPVRCSYYSITGDKTHEWTLGPLGVVYMDQQTYLVCIDCDGQWDRPRTLPMNRFSAAEIDELRRFVRPVSFDLDEFISEGNATFKLSNRLVPIELRLRATTARYVNERPLNLDQVLTPTGDPNWFTLRATVADDIALRNWLRALGSDVEVLSPQPLRREFIELASELAKRYLTLPPSRTRSVRTHPRRISPKAPVASISGDCAT